VDEKFQCLEGYKKTLQTWISNSEGALIQSWRPPSSVYVSGGRKYHADPFQKHRQFG
jgi:hypothetical protein